ncbi:MAG: ScpA family protein [Alphaproteobacteria bacterium]|nr:ScpA family protein [Alphaproteobacteria bacterium]
MTDLDEFEAEPPRQTETSAFVVDIEGYEGPIDVLLALARDQKVDLAQISILQLADQYLDFVAQARSINLELAADYLVMAAWLAYLKSRLLLPDLGGEDEPSGEEMAAALAFQLRRLEAVRDTGTRLMARARPGSDPTAPPPMNAVVGLSAGRGLWRGGDTGRPLITHQANARVGGGPSALALRPPGPVPRPAGQLHVPDGSVASRSAGASRRSCAG